MYKVELIVKPKPGVRDPQGAAVEESLRGVGYEGVAVHHVGRFLSMQVEAKSKEDARARVEEMCKRMLVNPNLETFELTVRDA